MTCVGDNAAVITWYRSGRLVTFSDDRYDEVSFERDIDSNRQTAQLILSLVTPNEAGEYLCRDQTKHLNDSQIVRVHVTSPSELTASSAGNIFMASLLCFIRH
jgi:hypothetical protein